MSKNARELNRSQKKNDEKKVKQKITHRVNFEALFEWCPIEELPTARLIGAWIQYGITPWRWFDGSVTGID